MSGAGGEGRLSCRSAVVTGAAAGIGRAYARRLASEGATVAVLDLCDGVNTVAEVGAAGSRACP